MIQRGIALASLLLLVVFALALPASAQDATPAVTPAAATAGTPRVCTSDDMKQIIAQVGKMSDKISAASAAGSNTQTADQLTAGLVAWDDAYQTFFTTGVYAGFPPCDDGILIADTLGFLLNEQMTLASSALLSVNQPDSDITAALTSMVAVQSKLEQQTTDGFTAYAKSIGQGNATLSWFPACTADQLKSASALDDLETTWSNQVPALQAYLSNGTVDKTAYLALTKLVGDYDTALMGSNWGCAELYRRVANDLYIFGDSFTALTLGEIAPSMKNNDGFTQVQQYFNSVINGYLTTLLGTPEATEASS